MMGSRRDIADHWESPEAGFWSSPDIGNDAESINLIYKN
jgi:hypothetical protein